jgi:hypothetical protein
VAEGTGAGGHLSNLNVEKAGGLDQSRETVFEAPITHEEALGPLRMSNVRDPAWYEKTNVPLEASGALPFARYVIRQKGKIEVGNLSCAMCHVRVMPDGTSIKGAQGNFPFDRVIAFNLRERTAQAKDKQQRLGQIRLEPTLSVRFAVAET